MFQMYSIFCLLLMVCPFGLTQGSNSGLQCVPIRDCPKLSSMLKPPLSPQKLGLLRSSLCGYDQNNHAIVKCEQPPTTTATSNCKTVDGQPGTCTLGTNCTSITKYLKDNQSNLDVLGYIDQLKSPQCTEAIDATAPIIVCCPHESPTVEILATDPPSLNEQSDHPNLLPNPDQGQCGIQETIIIANGKVTEMEEFPWTALLEYRSTEAIDSTCAGSLISNKYVVTAAHCADTSAIKYLGNLTNVILGEYDKTTSKDCTNYMGVEDCADPPLRVSVESVIVHDQWETRPLGQINHDIALIRLAEAVTFTNYIKPICLPSMTLTVEEKEKFVVTGWGKTVKLKTKVVLSNRDACIEKYKNKRLEVGEGEICGESQERGGNCPGDSGGPLMSSVNINGTGMWFLVGVVSFGYTQVCGINYYPTLYTYLPGYIDWIHRTVKP